MTRKKKPEDVVEELLAAPDTTKMSRAELLKYQQRKHKDEARKARLAAKKRKTRPTVEDMLGDMVEVAECPERNPTWHEWRTLSQKRYELFGSYPIEFIHAEFGQFETAKMAAGLADQTGTRLRRAARAVASRNEHTRRYADRYLLPYAAKPEDYRMNDGSYLLLSISDTHATFLDPFVWHCFLRAIIDLQPDGVLFNGDTLEGAEISRHPKIPNWTIPIQMEFDFHYEMARQVRAVGFSGDFFVGGGNHGIDRWAAYFTHTAKELANVRSLRIDKLLGLDDFNIKLFQGGTIMSPEGTEEDEQGFLLFDFYRIHHGTKLGQFPALAELISSGRSGQSGHVHRGMLATGCTEASRGLNWMCTPMGCTERAGRAYIKDPNKPWNKGFGIARLFPNGQVRQYPVLTDGDICTVEGFVYTRPRKLKDPDPQKLWLPQLPLPM